MNSAEESVSVPETLSETAGQREESLSACSLQSLWQQSETREIVKEEEKRGREGGSGRCLSLSIQAYQCRGSRDPVVRILQWIRMLVLLLLTLSLFLSLSLSLSMLSIWLLHVLMKSIDVHNSITLFTILYSLPLALCKQHMNILMKIIDGHNSITLFTMSHSLSLALCKQHMRPCTTKPVIRVNCSEIEIYTSSE